ncbi:YhcG family protein [Acidithiobacillus sp.]|jgi:predicted nuclease of restriction endonuclease-like (RecB) superfamily|uniref:PDDEXK nuclease domain-containing protein n=1 Tax=Acidithiobacillus sp. TaxID=1872118 RepID=UPI00356680C9
MTKKKLPSTITALPAERPIEPVRQGDLMARVATILDQARTNVLRAVNSNMVIAYWLIGREIVQALQGGEDRADYGSRLLAELSESLKRRYGRGFSVTNLKYFRLFFQAYALRTPEIRHNACDELDDIDQAAVLADLSTSLDEAEKLKGFSPNLSWSHYRSLSMVEHRAERLFYEIEAERCNWSQPVLERQIHSHLFARLLKSRDKSGVLKLASEGQTVERPIDMIKHPYVLDFLEIPEAHQLHESDLEAALLEKLQPFLLELGKGFAFVARQQRISTESQHFYIDLVFYNYLLKCFVLIDLKMGKLTHQDVGQMDMYVRMYDDLKRAEGDNPSVGLILCAERDEVVARYSVLHESQQLFASKYMLYLPTEAELRAEIAREQAAIEAARRLEDKE